MEGIHMKAQKFMLAVAMVVLFSATAGAMPLTNIAGYYKFDYERNTYAARVEEEAGKVRAYILPDNTMYSGVIQGDEIIFHDTAGNWGRLRQIDENTALISAYKSNTGELMGEFSVVRITEQEANQIGEHNRILQLNQSCAQNLKTIGLALHIYAKEHNNELPYDLAELYPTYIADKKTFVCPVRGGEFRDFEMDYQYLPGFSLDSPNPDSELVITEVNGNHEMPYPFHYVLYLDGHVESLPDAWISGLD
jgi:hypothetical protein